MRTEHVLVIQSCIEIKDEVSPTDRSKSVAIVAVILYLCFDGFICVV